MSKRPFGAIAILAMGISSSNSARAACRAGAPAGHFEGRAESRQAGTLDVSLSLRCTDARYEGELASPLGVFPIADGSFDGARLHLVLRAGDDSVTIDAAFAKPSLRGSFTVGDDTGTIELQRTGNFRAPQSRNAAHSLTTEQWRKDIAQFAAELPKRHIEPFHFTPRAQWLAEVTELELTVGSMDADQIYVALNRLANRIGDAHTYVEFPDDDARLPITVRQFGIEHRVVSVAPGYERALGTRITSFDDMPIEKAIAILREMAPRAETEMLADSRIEDFVTVGMLLHGSGITRDRNTARFGLRDDKGVEFVITAKARDAAVNAPRKYAYAKRPLWLDRPKESFWFVWLPESRTIYCNFRGYEDLRSNARALLKAVEEHTPEKLVIDMRRNGGGDYTVGLEQLIEPIRKLASINRPNHLFVIVGPDTFSAAMANAAHFRERTAAILVGEAIGERPNSNQEPREFRLRNSQLIVRYSTRRYEFDKQNRENVIRPDHEIRLTWEMYKAGRDPVLEWIEAVRVQ